MAVIIKKQPPKAELPPITQALSPPPAPMPAPALPAIDFESRLALQSASTEKLIRELAVTMAGALAAMPSRQGPPPTWDFDVKYDFKGQITNIRATPVQPS